MAGRIIYLEVDDEITSAAARIRGSDSARIAVVLPYGSRVATSRINFRLLARDALTHDKRLSIVTGDPATRALAASAGLPVFASVAEYESAMAGADDEGPRPATTVPVVAAAAAAAATADRVGRARGEPSSRVDPAAAAPPTEPESDGTLGLVVPVAAVGAATLAGPPGDTIRAPVHVDSEVPRYPRPAPPTSPADGGTRGPLAALTDRFGGSDGVRTPWLIGGAILALALLVGAIGIYLLLPSATIAVTPRAGADRADPGDDRRRHHRDPARPGQGRRPRRGDLDPGRGQRHVQCDRQRVELTKATGTVRFENLDPTSTNRIAAGSIVRTASGVRFRTNATITVPRAELVGLTIFPARASVKVTAVDGGPDGNVEAGTITIVPSGENSFFLKVTNPQPTSGGTSEEFSRVTQADVDGALAALNLSLAQAFQEAMDDPALEADGATVFPSTGRLGEPTPDVVPDTLVGQEVATFALGLSANGTVIAVDEAPVSAIAETQIREAVTPGHELVPGSIEVEVGEALIIGQSVSFPVDATAEQIAILDADELKAMILGKPIEEARAILAPFGQVSLEVSPDWTGSIPGFESRVTLTIDQAVPIETPGRPRLRRRRVPPRRRRLVCEPQPVTRLLGIDLGERRIGLAVADDDGSAARPHSTLRRGRDLDADAAALAAVVEALGIDALVVGLPLEASGEEGPMATQTRAWGDAIRERLDLPVSFRDERLSSHLAEARLGPMKRGRSGGPPSKTQRDAHRARVDREAAAIILQDELDTRAGVRSSMPRPQDPQETDR